MGFWDDVREILEKIVQFFKSEEAQQLLAEALKVAVMIVKVIAMFNDPPPSERKPQVARDIFKFIKYAPPGALLKIEELKEHGKLNQISSADMDRVLGEAIAAFVEGKVKDKKGKAR